VGCHSLKNYYCFLVNQKLVPRVFTGFDVSNDLFQSTFPKDKRIQNQNQTRLTQYWLQETTKGNINEEWNIKHCITKAVSEVLGTRNKKYNRRGLRI